MAVLHRITRFKSRGMGHIEYNFWIAFMLSLCFMDETSMTKRIFY